MNCTATIVTCAYNQVWNIIVCKYCGYNKQLYIIYIIYTCITWNFHKIYKYKFIDMKSSQHWFIGSKLSGGVYI